MRIDTADHDGVTVFAVVGELGLDTDGGLLESVGDVLNNPGDAAIIDLGGVDYINSTGINTLVRLTAQANVQEQRVLYCRPTPMVLGVLRTTQLDRFFEIHPNLNDALTALKR